ncbi:MAG TPA: dephospho-CoA kinase, partial [Acidimicrobiales bacterium]|nr:dephospho-CoA kinase [Acidimicrobiales bacterium]
REVVVPGGPAYQPMVDRFGPGILDADGNIDRPAVAAIVFGDPEALADLNAITHPAIGLAMIGRKDEFADTDNIVVLDIPLLKPVHRETLSLAAVVVVDTPVDIALDRLVNLRGMPREDAEARIAAQIDRQTRLDGADLVIDNSGDELHLAEEVDRVWGELEKLRSRLPG